MLTKPQKTEQVVLAKKLVAESQHLVFADFTGVPTKMINSLKKQLKGAGARYRVFKKRLLKVAMGELGIVYDPTQFEAQVGVITIPGELTSAAGVVYKFTREVAREKREFKILGAYDLVARAAMSAEQFTVIAKLPSREALLTQVLGAFTAPLRAFMHLLEERGKKMVETK